MDWEIGDAGEKIFVFSAWSALAAP